MPEVKEGGEFWFGKNGPPVLQGVILNLDGYINNQLNPGYNIRFALQLKSRRYIHPKEFFEYLSDYETEEILQLAKEYTIFMSESQYDFDKYRSSVFKIVQCAHLLAKSEGESIVSFQETRFYADNFCTLILLHSLSNKGIIKANYENFTVFGTDKPLFDIINNENKPAEPDESKPEEKPEN